MLSGPALILACIGGVFAQRAAATLTGQRFRILTAMVSFGFACVALAIWVTPRPFAEDQDVDLDFRIVDNNSGEPIAAAYVRLTDPFDHLSKPPNALTRADGRAG